MMAKIPTFKTREEEAEFWAHHDLSEFDEDLEPADVQCVRPDQVVAVRLNKDDVETLKCIARVKGIGYTTLVRMWVRERLQAERA